MSIKEFFSNRTETMDNHRNKELQTKYYKVNQAKAMQALRTILEQYPKIKILDYSEEHGEITAEFIKPRKAFVVVSVITVSPYRTAVDLTITTSTILFPMDWGYSRKAAIHLYNKFEKELGQVGIVQVKK